MMDLDETIIEKPNISELATRQENSSLPFSAATSFVQKTEPICSFYTDIEGYLSRYDRFSETRLQRLLFLASAFSQEAEGTDDSHPFAKKARSVAKQCYEWIEEHCKHNGNTTVYRQVFTISHASTLAAGSDTNETNATLLTGSTTRDVKNEPTPQRQGPSGAGVVNEQSKFSGTAILHHLHHDHPHVGVLHNGSHPYDAQWLAHADQAAHLQLEVLQSRLVSAQSQLLKEAIRISLLSLGDFYVNRGLPREALKYILKSRDVCTSHIHSCEMCFKVIEISLDMGDYAQASNFARKAAHSSRSLMSASPEQNQQFSSPGGGQVLSVIGNIARVNSAKSHAASALCLLLHERNYGEAGLKFASVPMDLTSHFNTVLSAEDIVLYGTILCLASQDRDMIQHIFGSGSGGDDESRGTSADSSAFASSFTIKQRLELLPWLSDLVQHSMRAEYGPCLSLLQRHMHELELDLRLHPHVQTLYTSIRNKCMVQYLVPFMSVDIDKMNRQFAGCFSTNVSGIKSSDSNKEGGSESGKEALEETLVQLIGRGDVRIQQDDSSLVGKTEGLQARLNCKNKAVVLRRSIPCRRRQHLATHQKIQLLSENFQRDTEALLLRTACIEQGLMISAEHHAGSEKSEKGNDRGRSGGRRQVFGGGLLEGDAVGFEVDSSDDEVAPNDGMFSDFANPAFQMGFTGADMPMEENGQDV